mmetsp:Transcript_13882/g.38500  ORF Transcript_13882/g.38500 Transcript_13882/m.38500 type:complete len:213 (+) Transcript_13882:217-855(+)
MPKSMSLTCRSPVSPLVSRIFSRLRSQCAMPCPCKSLTTEIVCLTSGIMRASRSLPGHVVFLHQAKSSPSVARDVTTYVTVSSRKTPKSWQAAGKARRFSSRRIPRSRQGCSELPGKRSSKARGPRCTQALGIRFTATRRPASSPCLQRISSTRPRFRTACCRFLKYPKPSFSHRSTLRESSSADSSKLTLVKGACMAIGAALGKLPARGGG